MKASISKFEQPDDIRIIEEKIHPKVFNDFYNYLEQLENKSAGISSADGRYQFAILAKEGTIESLRKIEGMIKAGNLSKEDSDFAIIALNLCRFKIENKLLDNGVDMVSGGLGGTRNRIRYYLAVTAEADIMREQFETIGKCFEIVAGSMDSVIEEVKHHGFYVSLIILGSFDYAIGETVESGIKKCEFLNKDYYLTNVEIPTDERIRFWLEGNLDNEKDEFPLSNNDMI